MTAWMESIELIKLHLDTRGDLLRFQRNTELKRNNKQKYNDMPQGKKSQAYRDYVRTLNLHTK